MGEAEAGTQPLGGLKGKKSYCGNAELLVESWGGARV